MCFKDLNCLLKEALENILANVDITRKIFVWGYWGNGKVIVNLLQQNNIKNIGIIDSFYEDDFLEVKKPDDLWQMKPDEAIIILAMKNSEEAEKKLEEWGGWRNINYFPLIKEALGEEVYRFGYMQWLENKYDLDICTGKLNRDGKCFEYTLTPWGTVQKILNVLEIEKEDTLFDFGMGKGGVLIQLAFRGIFSGLAGVEKDKELYTIACDNFEKLGLKNAKAICADARDVREELDEYDYFFFYNPFGGSVFETVISNIKNSFQRKKRKIRIIYINTVCHEVIMKSGIFTLEKQVEVGHWYPMANIYIANNE